MNIFLVPYTAFRHIYPAIVTSAAALLAWWLVLTWVVVIGPWAKLTWGPGWDGPVYLGAVAAAIAGASTLSEGSLRRTGIGKRVGFALGSAALSGGLAVGFCFLWGAIGPRLFGPDAGDPTLASLRFQLPLFALAGVASAAGPAAFRRGRGLMDHLGAGLVGGMVGAAVFHIIGYQQDLWQGTDLFFASGAAALCWGGAFGLLAWGIPTSLYAGWLRVLSTSRYGRRIPIDAPISAGTPAASADGESAPAASHGTERFVGHFPRGLDLWLDAGEGVQEIHLSIAVDANQRYSARGLSQYPVRVKRFLESVDLRYDPRRAAPLETRLQSGDRITLGDGQNSCELEFVMLPREEK